MIAKVLSGGLWGIDSFNVEVEIDIGRGLPSFTIVGLPESSVREARERVRSAFVNSGYEFPMRKITVNLAPADVKKEGSFYDLPIAIGIMVGIGLISQDVVREFFIAGELSLDGKLKGIRGALSFAIGCKKSGIKKIILPLPSADEASVIDGIEVYGFESLHQCVEFLRGERLNEPLKFKGTFDDERVVDVDMSEIKGQINAKRAIEICAAGNHNLLMIGPPGVGKSMLAQRIPTVLPAPTFEEIIETTQIYSVRGLLKGGLLKRRPFRAPHHTISDIGMIGGGNPPMPGEISLAHNGVLFLDELPEFDRNVIEALRQPMESGEVIITRASRAVRYPAKFMLVGAMNPCPCGYLGDPKRECRCSYKDIKRYRKKVSGPILDRFDIQVQLPPLSYEELSSTSSSETSLEIRKRIEMARKKQVERFGCAKWNSDMKPKDIKKFCPLDEKSKSILASAVEKLNLTARGYFKVIKVARTIADLDNSEEIKSIHIAEAIQFRISPYLEGE
jgi:magnesium chelatase family protein